MALVVDKTVKYLNVPDASNFTFQCSKPMSQLTADDVKSADFWVGFTSFAHNQMCEGNVESGLPQNDPDHCWCWATDNSALYDGDWSTAHWSFPANYPTGIYMRNILVECASAHSQNVSLQNDASARIIMNIEAGEDTKLQDLYISGSSYVTCPYSNENRVTDYRYIKPAVLLIVNDVLYVWIQSFAPYMTGFFCNSTTSQGYRSTQSFDDFSKLANHYLGLGWTRALQTGDMYTDSGSTTSVNFNYTVPDVDFNGVTADLNVSLGSANYNKRASVSIIDNEDKEIEKWYTAFTGFKFKIDDVWYKPIVEGGIVTGYTDDMTVTSEWDEWDNISGHNVPVTPPVPPSPSGDDLDDIDLSDALYGAGMAHYYICTKASGVLDTISEAMGNLRFSEAGTNLFPNLISCKLFPSGTGAVPAVNSTFKIAGKELLDPDDEQPISIQEVTGSPSIIIDDIAIDRKFGDFRDYAPYTMIELYVPFCGWTALPSWSMGGTVSGKIIIDIIDGSCKAVIEVTKNGKKTPVAELSGCCSLDIPFTAENVGAKMAGIMSAMSASATAALESAVGVGTMTVTGGKSGGKSVISGLTSYAASLCQATLVNNQNYTQVTGRTGDGCNLGGITDIVLKIQRPNTTEYSAPLYVPDGFAHAIGFMSMKQKKVSECTGLIICDNVDTSGIGGATDDERAEIKRVLETGLYVNTAPE